MTDYRGEGDRYRPMVQRRDRRWEIQAGGKRFAIVFSDHRSSAPVASFQRIRRVAASGSRGPSISKTVGMVLGSIAGAGLIGIAIQSGRASAGVAPYVVSIAVPEAKAPPATAPVTQRMVSRPVPPPIKRATLSAPTEPTGDAYISEPIVTGFTTPQTAVAAALRTGSLQQWSREEGDERGFVVAGPIAEGCRDLSILTRRVGDDDRVEKRRECLSAQSSAARIARP